MSRLYRFICTELVPPVHYATVRIVVHVEAVGSYVLNWYLPCTATTASCRSVFSRKAGKL